jgi:hypothetical protein
MVSKNQHNSVAQAVRAAGGQVAAARQLGCTQQNVSSWVCRGFAPLERAKQLEELTGVPVRTLVNPKFAAMGGL